ncbi:MAG: hypothetical protein V7754_10890 [Halioglobus sp.]
MAEVKTNIFGSVNRFRAFTAVKYLTYALLSINVLLFLQAELLALEHTFAGSIKPWQFIQSFAETVDTAAWVVLLLLFELETSVLDDSRIRGGVQVALHGVRGLCYLVIGYAFTGYFAELVTLYDVVPFPGMDPCTLLGQDFSILVGLDDYLPIDAENCVTLGANPFQFVGFSILSGAATLESAQYLGWADVINAATWILVCVVLEVEVRLQLRGRLSDRIMTATKYLKFSLYGILFCAAIYWGFRGDFLDFWDACLWLFAFIFIELNVFEWQFETTHEENKA